MKTNNIVSDTSIMRVRDLIFNKVLHGLIISSRMPMKLYLFLKSVYIETFAENFTLKS